MSSDGTNGAGDCPRVIVDGKEWKVGWPTKGARKRLQNLVAAQAIREIEELRDVLPLELYAKKADDVLALIAGKQQHVGGKLWHRVMESEHGTRLFLLALMREHHPDVTEDVVQSLLVAHPAQIEAAVLLVVPNFYQLVAADLGLPPDQQEKAAATARARLAALSSPTPP